MWIYPSGKQEKTKLGIIVSRKVDARAVKRNLWKRRIRENFRLMQSQIPAGRILLIQALRPGKVPALPEIRTEIEKLLSRLE